MYRYQPLRPKHRILWAFAAVLPDVGSQHKPAQASHPAIPWSFPSFEFVNHYSFFKFQCLSMRHRLACVASSAGNFKKINSPEVGRLDLLRPSLHKSCNSPFYMPRGAASLDLLLRTRYTCRARKLVSIYKKASQNIQKKGFKVGTESCYLSRYPEATRISSSHKNPLAIIDTTQGSTKIAKRLICR